MSLFAASSASATGSDVIITVPAGQQWRIKAVEIDINASAAAANRETAVEVQVNGFLVLFVPSLYVQTAGDHTYYSFAPGLASNASAVLGDDVTTGLSETVLGPGDTIRSATDGLQSGDAVTMSVNYEAELVP